MNFSNWHETLPDDEKITLCKNDVWEGAINIAIDHLRAEHMVLMRNKLPAMASGVSIGIEILKALLLEGSTD